MCDWVCVCMVLWVMHFTLVKRNRVHPSIWSPDQCHNNNAHRAHWFFFQLVLHLLILVTWRAAGKSVWAGPTLQESVRPIKTQAGSTSENVTIKNHLRVKQRSWNCVVTFVYAYILPILLILKLFLRCSNVIFCISNVYCLGKEPSYISTRTSSTSINNYSSFLKLQFNDALIKAASMITASEAGLSLFNVSFK